MAKQFPPATMRAWQYASTKGGIEKNMNINIIGVPKPKPNEHLVQVLATALNPIDYKPVEIPYIGSLIRPKLATPGIDFVGKIVTPAANSTFKSGQLIFGVSGTSPIAGGALKEFTLVTQEHNSAIALPEGVSPIDAATVGVAGFTAYQSIVPRVKKGDHIFINGGSGGTGVFGIQIAKAVGCHVTTSCSTVNVGLCESLGADVVIDYKKTNVVEALMSAGWKFDHAVDNAGQNRELLWKCGDFLKPGASIVLVAGGPSLDAMTDSVKRKVTPKFLGGVKGKVEGFWPKPNIEDLTQIAQWMKEGKIKAVIDSKFAFEEAPKAFERLKTGRAKGKIVVDVALECYEK